jgi:hypothetical protein
VQQTVPARMAFRLIRKRREVRRNAKLADIFQVRVLIFRGNESILILRYHSYSGERS